MKAFVLVEIFGAAGRDIVRNNLLKVPSVVLVYDTKGIHQFLLEIEEENKEKIYKTVRTICEIGGIYSANPLYIERETKKPKPDKKRSGIFLFE